jgi:hypothetical protein
MTRDNQGLILAERYELLDGEPVSEWIWAPRAGWRLSCAPERNRRKTRTTLNQNITGQPRVTPEADQ